MADLLTPRQQRLVALRYGPDGLPIRSPPGGRCGGRRDPFLDHLPRDSGRAAQAPARLPRSRPGRRAVRPHPRIRAPGAEPRWYPLRPPTPAAGDETDLGAGPHDTGSARCWADLVLGPRPRVWREPEDHPRYRSWPALARGRGVCTADLGAVASARPPPSSGALHGRAVSLRTGLYLVLPGIRPLTLRPRC